MKVGGAKPLDDDFAPGLQLPHWGLVKSTDCICCIILIFVGLMSLELL